MSEQIIHEQTEASLHQQEVTQCAACRRSVNDGIRLYKYEFGQKMSYFNWIEGVELMNPHYACVYLCGTDTNLAARVRKQLGSNATPIEILQKMIEYRNVHSIEPNYHLRNRRKKYY
jgi:hypothetical protein